MSVSDRRRRSLRVPVEAGTNSGGANEGSPLLGGSGGGASPSPSTSSFSPTNSASLATTTRGQNSDQEGLERGGSTPRRRHYTTDSGEEVMGSLPVTGSGVGEAPGRQKWVLLLMFCMLAFIQNAVFVEFNPIAISAKHVFPTWSDATFAWQINCATITSPIVQWPAWWAIQKFGLSRTLRWGAVFPLFLSSLLTALPLTLSATSSDDYMACTYAAYFLIGVTGVVFFSSITRFSGLWFPSEQRATATGLTITCANMGSLLPALTSPLIVSDPGEDSNDTQSCIPGGSTTPQHSNAAINTSQSRPPFNPTANSSLVNSMINDDVTQVRSEILSYFLMYLGLSTVLMTVFLVYFPREKPPSRRRRNGDRDGDETTRQLSDLRVVLKTFAKLISKPRILFIMILQALSSVPFIWGVTLLTVTLSSPLKVDQKSISGLIIVTTLVASAATILVSRVADICFRFRLKVLTLILLALHAGFMIGLGVCVLKGDTSYTNIACVYVFYVAAISLLNATSPLMYELTAEMSYPITEEFLGGLLNQFNNLVGVLFYAAFSQLSKNDECDHRWLFYLLMIAPTIVTIGFFFVRESYSRSDATSSGMMIITDAGTEATAFITTHSAPLSGGSSASNTPNTAPSSL